LKTASLIFVLAYCVTALSSRAGVCEKRCAEEVPEYKKQCEVVMKKKAPEKLKTCERLTKEFLDECEKDCKKSK
jgi:hypothetical protein